MNVSEKDSENCGVPGNTDEFLERLDVGDSEGYDIKDDNAVFLVNVLLAYLVFNSNLNHLT